MTMDMEEEKDIIEVEGGQKAENISENTITEIYFTDEQAELIQRAIQREFVQKKSFAQCVRDTITYFFKSIFDFLISTLTLKNSGKWVSVITVGFVLGVLTKFLMQHNFSPEAMKIVIPSITQIAVIVFSVIGGFKGVQSLAEKLSSTKKIVTDVKGIANAFKSNTTQTVTRKVKKK